MLRSHTHGHHPVGERAAASEIALYAEELKLVTVFKPSHRPREVRRHASTADVLDVSGGGRDDALQARLAVAARASRRRRRAAASWPAGWSPASSGSALAALILAWPRRRGRRAHLGTRRPRLRRRVGPVRHRRALPAAGLAAACSAAAARALARRAGALSHGLGSWSTAKLGLLPLPFFAAAAGLLEVYHRRLAAARRSLLHSLRLLALGYLLGAARRLPRPAWRSAGRAASATGSHPILRFIGPLPATAWLPLAFFVFPVQLQRQHLPDRAGHRLPGRRC